MGCTAHQCPSPLYSSMAQIVQQLLGLGTVDESPTPDNAQEFLILLFGQESTIGVAYLAGGVFHILSLNRAFVPPQAAGAQHTGPGQGDQFLEHPA